MPFAKRTVEPQQLCRRALTAEDGSPPPLEDLRAVSNSALSRTVRQLSDVARHAGSLFHELERELVSTDRRLRDLRDKVRRMERSCEELDPKEEAVEPDPDSVSLGHRSRFPVPNVPSPLDTQTNWIGVLPLPTPEDRMKSQSQAIVSCVVPIDVTEDSSGAARPSGVSTLLNSDESPVASEQTIVVHSSPEAHQENLTLTRLNTRDSGCQTEDLLIAVAGPSRRRIRAQRGQSATFPLSHSTGNIPSLPDSSNTMFSASVSSNLRSQSLPRDGVRLIDKMRINSDNDEEDGELSPFEEKEFLPVPDEKMLNDEEECTDDQVHPERQLSFNQHPKSREHVWMLRHQSHLPCKTDEISSSSETFSSPVHSNAGVLASQMDHKEDHQSSSGNWSGSSSTCPSQTSEQFLLLPHHH
ncbi:Nance-Horan syndrome protein [Bagarius yarrelli]|uniref:Nance-Horan syndrome protein n=1 Tax=Bagarius yarrelli TaxID=175774 RepID=A0A556VBY5_BAGYA|nr:Nance-Horan syndrome protein [Bagarius yarrelli]